MRLATSELPPGPAQVDPIATHGATVSMQSAPSLVLETGREPSVVRHDAPPRDVTIGRGHDASDGTGGDTHAADLGRDRGQVAIGSCAACGHVLDEVQHEDVRGTALRLAPTPHSASVPARGTIGGDDDQCRGGG